MTPILRLAQLDDVRQLVDLMTEFYAESDYPLDPERAAWAFQQLVGNEGLGRVWLMVTERTVVGYAVLTLGFSLEFGGRDAFVDDLFVRPEFRHHGFGTAALAELERTCRELGVRALHLEVERTNEGAQRLYRAAGFEDTKRQLLTLRLAAPLHVAE